LQLNKVKVLILLKNGDGFEQRFYIKDKHSRNILKKED